MLPARNDRPAVWAHGRARGVRSGRAAACPYKTIAPAPRELPYRPKTKPAFSTTPCQGGIKMQYPLPSKGSKPTEEGGFARQCAPRRAEGALLFLAPLTRGGRGGCFSSFAGTGRRSVRCAKRDGVVGEDPRVLPPRFPRGVHHRSPGKHKKEAAPLSGPPLRFHAFVQVAKRAQTGYRDGWGSDAIDE